MNHDAPHPDPLIRADGLSKRFRLYDRPRDRLFEWLSANTITRHCAFWALQNIDIDVRPGECLGVIGRNGSGKSTLLKLLSGALIPTRGQVDVRGRVYALLELGTGFNKQLTGRQNIAHAGAMLGLPNAYIKEREAQIIAFADLGRFIDVPVRSYSSGMMSRLAFSLFAFLDPDVLMIDEVLSVGDEAFKARCFELIDKRVADGRAVVYVSHALRTMVRLCDRVLWLEDGAVVEIGDPTSVVNAFVERHRTSSSGEHTERDASAPSQPTAPSADAITPERLEDDDAPDPPDGACLVTDETVADGGTPIAVRKLWLESPLGDVRENAPAGLSFVVAARVHAAADDPTPLSVEIETPQGTLIGGARVAVRLGLGRSGVLRLLCNAGLGPGEHTLRVRSRDGTALTAKLPVIGSAPTPGGIVLFRRVTLRERAGD